MTRQRAAMILAVIPILLAASGWLGWLTDLSFLTRVRSDYLPMAPNTATSFLLASFALLATLRGRKNSVVFLLLVPPTLLCGIRVLEILGGFQTGVERLLWSPSGPASGPVQAGEMAMGSALCLLFLVVAIGRLSTKRRFDIPASVLAGMSLSIGLFFLLAYLYRAPLLHGSTTVPMALTSALAFAFASASVLVETSRRFSEFDQRSRNRRQELTDALQESNDNLQSLVDGNPNGLLVLGLNEERLFANPAAEELLAHIPPETLESKPHLDGQFELDDGRVVYATTHPIQWRGSEAFLISIKDTSELRRSEIRCSELETQFLHSQKMEAVGRLAGGVAHDFNNLLTAIIGYTTMLLGCEQATSFEEELEEILKASNRAADLSHRLLALSRAHSLVTVTLDLKERVQQTETLLRRLLRPDISFVCKFDDSEPAWVQAVPSAIEQVVLNLVVNAQDAVEGQGRITLEVGKIQLDETYADSHFQIEPGSYVLLKVSDTGTGIPPEHLPHIFEPYYTTKEKGKGTGLGLSTIYGIVQQSQGSVHVYSIPGRGTTFKVYLPEVLPPNNESSQSKPVTVPTRSSMRVLLVEDEHSIQRLATRLLERAGHSVACCDSAEKALNLLGNDAKPYDLLVTDMMLPGQSGLDLACKVPTGMPMILMSGYSEQGLPDREEVLQRIVFLEKPFSLAQFESKIDEAVRRPHSGACSTRFTDQI